MSRHKEKSKLLKHNVSLQKSYNFNIPYCLYIIHSVIIFYSITDKCWQSTVEIMKEKKTCSEQEVRSNITWSYSVLNYKSQELLFKTWK